MNSDEDCADSVTCLYATRFFRKRPQITPALLRVVSGALHSPNSALKCLYIWGVHEKPLPDSDDDATIAHLQALLERIGSLLRVNLTMQIVIADSHGQLNEARSELSDQYARAITARLKVCGWGVLRMSDLWRDGDITLTKVDELASHLDVASDAPRLLTFAKLHYHGASAEQGARRYLAARLLERPVLSSRFEQHILLTPVEPALDSIQPQLPIFHIWTRKKGCSAKPWFPRGIS